MTTIALSDLKPKQSGIITGVSGDGRVRQRISDMGVVRGTSITMTRTAPLGDPLEFQVKGYRLSLRKSEANQIMVEIG